MTFTAAEQDKIDPLVRAFREYCMGRVNIIIACFHFHTQPGNGKHENVHHHSKGQNKRLDYGMLDNSLLRDHLVAGVHNTTLHNKLLQTTDLTLAKWVDICELSEFNSKQLETEHDHSTMQEVDYIELRTVGVHPLTTHT